LETIIGENKLIEEVIISGRSNPEIDPSLHVWGWEIPFYLFIGGLVAGILFFSALYTIRGKENNLSTAVKLVPLATPILLGLGLFSLLLDLSHKLFFWKLYTNIRWESPMSWGAWTLMLIYPLTIVWSAIWIKDVFPNWNWKFQWVDEIISKIKIYKLWIAWALVILSIILGMYTGILLSAFNARPFWNTAILGPLFLTSGLSAGAATIVLLSKNKAETKLFTQIDLLIIGIELFLITHLFMGFLASTQVHIEAAGMFLGGSYTAIFWVFVVGLGLVLPAILESLELAKFHIPPYLASLLVLVGSLILRFVIVDAGQASRWLY